MTPEKPGTPEKQRIVDLLAGFSIETTPGAAAKTECFRALLAPGTCVYVTFLAGSNFADTMKTVKRLSDEGLRPVPHIAARGVPGHADLAEWLERMRGEAGIDEVLLIAGGRDKPLGEFDNTLQLLATGLFEKHGIRRIGVAGHPEGSPDFSEEAAMRALLDKNAYARETGCEMVIVTQFVFDAKPVIEWDRRIRAAGNTLPVRIGIPGLATIKTLLAHARICGIGPSVRILTRRAGSLAKLMSLRIPDRLVADLAAAKAQDPQCGIERVHIYPFGGMRKTAAWTYAVLDGAFEMNAKGGFDLNREIE